jgi:hemolysin III
MNYNDLWPRDGGPLYRETHTYLQTNSHWIIVEPWNAASSLLFVMGAIWLWIYIKKKKISFPLLQYGFIPLLLIGGIGSTLYHAFRASWWLMSLDVFPMFLLTLLIGFYFWNLVTKKIGWTIVILLCSILLRTSVFYLNLPMQKAINTSYFIMGMAMFFPVAWIWVKTKFSFSRYLLGASFSIALSFFFRWFDDVFTALPMGVHWLWHLFSVVGAMFAGLYLIHIHEYVQHNTCK